MKIKILIICVLYSVIKPKEIVYFFAVLLWVMGAFGKWNCTKTSFGCSFKQLLQLFVLLQLTSCIHNSTETNHDPFLKYCLLTTCFSNLSLTRFIALNDALLSYISVAETSDNPVKLHVFILIIQSKYCKTITHSSSKLWLIYISIL